MNRFEVASAVVRSLMAAFPAAGGVVNAWNEYLSAQQKQRIESMMDALLREVEDLTGRVERSEEECASVFDLALRRASEDPDNQKAQLYASLVAAFCDGSIERDAALNLIYECETLLPYDVEVLGRLSRKRVDATFGFDESTNRSLVSKCQSSIKKLEAKGLVGLGGDNNQFELHRMYENAEAWPFTFYQQFFIVLEQGEALLQVLKRTT